MLSIRPLLCAGAALGAALAPLHAAAQGAAPAVVPAVPAAEEGALPVVRARARAERETATGPVQGYRARRAASATKTDTPLSETPQAVTVITRDQIVDQGATNTQDALGYAAGVRSDAYGLDSRTDTVRVRGAFPVEYLDGLRKTNGYYTSNGRTELYTLERLEVLRGPSAMLFGQGSTGGVVNLVSKRPLAERQGEVGLQVGSFGRRQLQADLTGPLTADGEWLYRLVAVGRVSDTQVDQVRDDRRLLAPSLTWRPNAATSLTLQALYQDDRSGSTSQFLPWIGTLLPSPAGPVPSNAFIGQPGDHYDTERRTLGWLFEHRLNEAWTLRQNLRWARNRVDYLSAYGDSFTVPGDWAADPGNKRLIDRFYYAERTQLDTVNADQHVEGRIDTGAVEHRLLAGLDLSRFKTRQATGIGLPTSMGGNVPPVDAYNPVYPAVPVPTLTDRPLNTLKQTGLYLQDQMKIHRRWIVVAGLRHDRVTNETAGRPDEEASATSKRLGLMHAFDNGWSPYVSYSESFTPQANLAGQSFRPLRGEQWEVGVKVEPAGRALAFNVAAYDLREKNRINTPQPNVYNQLGQTKTRGVELEARGSLTRDLDLIAHYNRTDLDDQLEGLPRHQAAVWTKYRFALAGLPGFSVGAGVRWMGDFTDRQDGLVGPPVPSVALIDAMLAYDSGDWRLALNASNLGDKRYFSTCLNRGDCWYGTRRNVVATATYRF
ncbi:TonB-dependent siderophore receptor [Aquabacterium sp. J223]|uniref:TonB-dependent siderophore receptor n=1 Tax=Aquabacterium sp. J223 TaxID=2898431 RepID=UPI0021ADA7DD|nr:TonB-dependent siderophore receptor [Aquabacterium sp. J223]UUX94468.1 TonB-dependent siderophore receptor [Aquabacterium sp. J223]